MPDPKPRRWWTKLLSALGVQSHAANKEDDSGPRRLRFRARFYILAGLAAVAVILTGAIHYSESPAFCHSCHIMEPYYAAWKASKHNGVACVQCHYAPSTPRTHLWHKFQALSQVVKYVTRTYSSRPFAEVDDASCLRSGCHSTRLLQGKLVTKTGINFDHRPHLLERRRGRQLRCVSCHSQVMVGKHIEVTYDTCILCHFRGKAEGRDIEPIGGCTGCHNLPKQNFKLANMTYNHRDFVIKRGIACTDCHSDILGGTGKVDKERCVTCHNQPEKVNRYNDIAFVHDNHVTKHHVACFHCHEQMTHGAGVGPPTDGGLVLGKPGAPIPAAPVKSNPADSTRLMAAGTKHPGVRALECDYCHENKHAGQREMYTGAVSSLGLPQMPSPMYRASVDCIACHYQAKGDPRDAEFRGRNWKASENACVKCHGSKFTGVWEETKREFQQSLGQLDGKLGAARLALSKASLSQGDKIRLAHRLDHADRWNRFVRDSRGEHNVYLASLALRKSDQEMTQVGNALKANLPDLSASPLLSGSYCATLCHAKVGVKVPPDTVRAFGKIMPHKEHTEQMGCVKCHDISGHKMVPLRRDVKGVCAGCHEPTAATPPRAAQGTGG